MPALFAGNRCPFQLGVSCTACSTLTCPGCFFQAAQRLHSCVLVASPCPLTLPQTVCLSVPLGVVPIIHGALLRPSFTALGKCSHLWRLRAVPGVMWATTIPARALFGPCALSGSGFPSDASFAWALYWIPFGGSPTMASLLGIPYYGIPG